MIAIARTKPAWLLTVACNTLGSLGVSFGIIGCVGFLATEGIGPKSFFPLLCSLFCGGLFLPLGLFGLRVLFAPSELVIVDGCVRLIQRNKVIGEIPLEKLDTVRTYYLTDFQNAKIGWLVVLIDFGGRHPEKHGAAVRLTLRKGQHGKVFWPRLDSMPNADEVLLTGVWDRPYKAIAADLSAHLIKHLKETGEVPPDEPGDSPFKF